MHSLAPIRNPPVSISISVYFFLFTDKPCFHEGPRNRHKDQTHQIFQQIHCNKEPYHHFPVFVKCAQITLLYDVMLLFCTSLRLLFYWWNYLLLLLLDICINITAMAELPFRGYLGVLVACHNAFMAIYPSVLWWSLVYHILYWFLHTPLYNADTFWY